MKANFYVPPPYRHIISTKQSQLDISIEVVAFRNVGQNCEGGFSGVNASRDILFDSVVGRYSSPELYKLINAFDVLSINADRKCTVFTIFSVRFYFPPFPNLGPFGQA